jgi:hypothetical protein
MTKQREYMPSLSRFIGRLRYRRVNALACAKRIKSPRISIPSLRRPASSIGWTIPKRRHRLRSLGFDAGVKVQKGRHFWRDPFRRIGRMTVALLQVAIAINCEQVT